MSRVRYIVVPATGARSRTAQQLRARAHVVGPPCPNLAPPRRATRLATASRQRHAAATRTRLTAMEARRWRRARARRCGGNDELVVARAAKLPPSSRAKCHPGYAARDRTGASSTPHVSEAGTTVPRRSSLMVPTDVKPRLHIDQPWAASTSNVTFKPRGARAITPIQPHTGISRRVMPSSPILRCARPQCSGLRRQRRCRRAGALRQGPPSAPPRALIHHHLLRECTRAQLPAPSSCRWHVSIPGTSGRRAASSHYINLLERTRPPCAPPRPA